MTHSVRTAAGWSPVRPALLLMAAAGLVHCLAAITPASSQTAKGKPPAPSVKTEPAPPARAAIGRNETLPAPVAEMREAILTAARSGRIDELRTPVELNELKPEIASVIAPDPIAYWRQTSADGEGREVMAAVLNILEQAPAVLPLGKDIENNRVFVWPYLAELGLDKLTPAEAVDLYRLLPAADAKAMIAKGRYAGWRLAIGADGVWHSFRRVE